jgi:hypothetical protein
LIGDRRPGGPTLPAEVVNRQRASGNLDRPSDAPQQTSAAEAPTLGSGGSPILREPGQAGSYESRSASDQRLVAGLRRTITAAGASGLDLPPYSPDLNPIEQLFAKRKALLRKPQPAPGTSRGRPSAVSARLCPKANPPAI